MTTTFVSVPSAYLSKTCIAAPQSKTCIAAPQSGSYTMTASAASEAAAAVARLAAAKAAAAEVAAAAKEAKLQADFAYRCKRFEVHSNEIKDVGRGLMSNRVGFILLMMSTNIAGNPNKFVMPRNAEWAKLVIDALALETEESRATQAYQDLLAEVEKWN